MKTARAARVWVYRDLTAASLRRHLRDARCLPRGLTPVGLKRVQREMEKLATWLEAKAAKYESSMPQTPAGLDDDHALIAGDE